jgi:hypothetical protein
MMHVTTRSQSDNAATFLLTMLGAAMVVVAVWEAIADDNWWACAGSASLVFAAAFVLFTFANVDGEIHVHDDDDTEVLDDVR